MSKYEVVRLTPLEWKAISTDTHLVVFEQARSADMDRIHYALIARDDLNNVYGYVTVKEQDSESVYWQYGGAFPSCAKTVRVHSVYKEFIEWTRSKYKRISAMVENKNIRYLKLAMAHGFKIIGVKNFKNTILIELLLDFEDLTTGGII